MGVLTLKEFIIGKNDAGQRLDRWLAKTLPVLPAPLAQKYIRLKRVKVNGKGSKRDARLNVGDVLQLYINDEFFDGKKCRDSAGYESEDQGPGTGKILSLCHPG